MAWFGFVNENASCFIDSVIVALFGADHGSTVHAWLLQPQLTEADVTRSELNAPSLQWRQQLQHALAADVALLMQFRTHGHTCQHLRQLMAAAPLRTLDAQGEEVVINFAAPQQQSAVDLLQYLLDALCARGTLPDMSVQHSTTFIMRRDRDKRDQSGNGAHAPTTLVDLLRMYKSSPVVKQFNAANAHELEDESERAALRADTTGTACVVETAAGDRRRISPPEPVTLFSCHLSARDASSSATGGGVGVDITRDLQPHVEFMDGIEGYTGPLYAKLMASRMPRAPPLLIFEVSRKLDAVRKLHTRVWYGSIVDATDGPAVVLRVHSRLYALSAVVCHIGDGASGHYIAFVRLNNTWFLYDDAQRGGQVTQLAGGLHELEHAGMARARPSESGELFFYTLVHEKPEL